MAFRCTEMALSRDAAISDGAGVTFCGPAMAASTPAGTFGSSSVSSYGSGSAARVSVVAFSGRAVIADADKAVAETGKGMAEAQKAVADP